MNHYYHVDTARLAYRSPSVRLSLLGGAALSLAALLYAAIRVVSQLLPQIAALFPAVWLLVALGTGMLLAALAVYKWTPEERR